MNVQFCTGSQIWTREAGNLFCSLPILWPWLHNLTLLRFCFLADEVGKMILLFMCCIHPPSCKNTLKSRVWVKMTWWVENICFTACIILLIYGNILRCNLLLYERFLFKAIPNLSVKYTSCLVMQNHLPFHVSTLSAEAQANFWGDGSVLYADYSDNFTGSTHLSKPIYWHV